MQSLPLRWHCFGGICQFINVSCFEVKSPASKLACVQVRYHQVNIYSSEVIILYWSRSAVKSDLIYAMQLQRTATNRNVKMQSFEGSLRKSKVWEKINAWFCANFKTSFYLVIIVRNMLSMGRLALQFFLILKVALLCANCKSPAPQRRKL